MLEELLIPQLKHLFEHRILLCHATIALMIACSDTDIYRTISLWIHSLPQRKGGNQPTGTSVAKLFVTHKGFLYVVPMRRKSKVLQAIKQFAKETGVPTSIIVDMAGEKMSQEAVMTLEQPYGHW